MATAPSTSALDVLEPVWWLGVAAVGVSLAVTPMVRCLAYRLGLVDRPDPAGEGLKPHARPIAYLGGLAMCVALLAGLACHVAVMPQRAAHWRGIVTVVGAGRIGAVMTNPLWQVLAIALGAVVITVVGLLDDLHDLPPRDKVAGQLLVAGILLVGGVGHRAAGTLTGPLLHPLGAPLPLWLDVPLSVVVCLVLVVGACNATNLLDGLDGLCGGVMGVIALGFLGLAVHLAMYDTAPEVDALRVGLSLAMAGAVVGFLPYNLPPASIFMGDAGSMLLGFFVAAMMMLFCTGAEGSVTTPRWFVAALAVFGLPILDTALAVVRRVRAGRSIFAGDRSHLYDQLVDRGMSVKGVVALFYVLAVIAAVMGVAVAVYLRGRYAVALYAVLLVAIAWAFRKLGMIAPAEQPRQAGRGADAPDEPAAR